MKKAFFVLMGTVVLFGFGCGKSVEEALVERVIENSAGGNAQVDLNGQTIKVETEDGTAEFGGTALPSDWPNDAPVYPGSSIQYSSSSNPTTGEAGAMVLSQTSDSAQNVLAYYKTTLAELGWNIEGTYQAGNTASVVGKKDARTIGVTIAGEEGSTTVTIVVGTE